MKIMVTGGAGFIGAHLCARLLADGARVGVLDDLSAGSPGNLALAYHTGLRTDDVFQEDVSSPAAAAVIAGWQPEVIVHLAAQSRVGDSVRDPRRGAVSNVVGTANLLAAAASAGVRKVVAASSGGTVYGELAVGRPGFVEAATRRPLSPYGASKAAADLYLRMYADTFDLTSTVLMLGNVYGPRADGTAGSDLIAHCVSGVLTHQSPVIYGDGTQTRDFVHVVDVVEAFRLACTRADGDWLNVATGRESSVREVVDLILRAAGATDLEVLSRPARPAEVRRVALDVSAARRSLGWHARIPLSDGIAELVGAGRSARAAAHRSRVPEQSER